MITNTKSYQTSDNKMFADISEAQAHEIELLIGTPHESRAMEAIALIIANADKVVEILTLTEKSRPAARKPRKSKKATTTPATT